MRQFVGLLKHIDRRTHNDYVGQAALHGVKLPSKGEEVKVSVEPLTPAQEQAISRALEDTKLKKAREHGRY